MSDKSKTKISLFPVDKETCPLTKEQFRAIIRKIAYQSSTKKQLKALKIEYDAFVSQVSACMGKDKDMKTYLNRWYIS